MITTEQSKRDHYHQQGIWGEKKLHDLLYQTAEKKPTDIALVDPANKMDLIGTQPQHLTYQQLTDHIDRLTSVLLKQGIGKDDILLVQMPNIIELVFVYMAASKLGAIISPVAVQYQEHELTDIIRILEPKAIISVARLKDSDLISHLVAATEHAELSVPIPQILVWGEHPDGFNLTQACLTPADLVAINIYYKTHSIIADDTLTICWTSGTEGTPKGIPRSHNQWLTVGRVTYESNKIEEGEALLNPFPFINMASIGGLFLSWLFSGGKLVLHHPMDLPVFLRQIAEEKISYTLAPPALLNTLLKNKALLASCDFSSIRAIGSGSAPLDEWMVDGFKKKFGIEVVNHFGSNEGVSFVCGPNETDCASKRARLFPRASDILETRLVDPESGELIEATGIQAELQIKGAGVFDGYYKAPEQTASAFTSDGYYRTGDLFEICSENTDFYRFVGRHKDLIIRGGMNIAPAELDNLLCAHNNINEAAVAGYPCEVMGERIAAFVVCKDGESMSHHEVVEYLKSCKVANFKLPEKLITISAIPRNPLGKINRHQLAAVLTTESTMESGVS